LDAVIQRRSSKQANSVIPGELLSPKSLEVCKKDETSQR